MAVWEPAAKSGCVSTTITSRVYVWGGETESGDHLHLRNLYIFDTRSEKWRQRSINGDHPAGYNNCAASQDSGFLYLYGGQDKDKKYTGSLHCLDLDLLIWRELSSHTHDGPKKKIDCGMVICGDKIILFGGLLEDGGCTNELHSFDLLPGIWLSPVSMGTSPPACRAFSLVKTGASTAMLFGGDNEGTASNQLFILELKNMHWSKVPHEIGDIWPEERCHHNGCCIAPDTDHTWLLITAGWKGEHDTYYNDIWLLDIKSMIWTKVNEVVHAEITSPEQTSVMGLPQDIILTGKDLSIVYDVTHPARANWYGIGLVLGISPDTLDAIQDNQSDSDKCLRKTLKHWLQNSTNRNWTALATAMGDKIVGRLDIKETILREHI